MKSLLFIPLIFMFGWGGTMTGQNEHYNNTPVVQVKYHYDKPNKKTTGKEKKDGFRHKTSK